MPEDEYQEQPINPQPQAGYPTPQSLEVISYLTNNKKFKVNKDLDPDDPDRLSDGDHPTNKDEDYWAVYNKDFILTDLDERDIDVIRLILKSNDCLAMVKRPEVKLSLQDIIDENNQEVLNIAKTNRSKHGFERRMINTSTQQTIYGQINQQQPSRGGMMGTLQSVGSKIFGGGMR